MVVGPEFDGRKPEAVDVHEFPQPRPGAVVEAHQIAAMRRVPGKFFPWVLRATCRLVEVADCSGWGTVTRPVESDMGYGLKSA